MLLLKYVHDTGFAKYTRMSKYTYALRRVLYAKKRTTGIEILSFTKDLIHELLLVPKTWL